MGYRGFQSPLTFNIHMREVIMAKSKGMTSKAASRVWSAEAKGGGGNVSQGRFAARAR